MAKVFMRAKWEDLIMASYEVEPERLSPWLPAHTELDLYQGRCFVSIVAFWFADTRLLGIKFPGHVHFEEVNLRFYVRYKAEEGWRRGACFISEIVPRAAIPMVANTLYREHYRRLPMRHVRTIAAQKHIRYEWKYQQQWYHAAVQAAPQTVEMDPASLEGFIAEHYWGYTRFDGQQTLEYQVEHPRWNLHPIESYDLKIAAQELYGPTFADLAERKPDNIFLADGSDIKVYWGRKIRS